MTPRLFLLRHWLACHMLVCLLISGTVRAEVRVIDRQPVGGGAEVVLTQSGTGGPCMLRYRSAKGGELEFYRVPVGCQPTPRIMRGEKRVSYQFMERDDCLIITLELDEEAPRVYEDRFRNAHGIDFSAGAKLLTADELGLYNMFDPLCEEKHLLRDESGHWTFRGLPYRKKVESKVTVFTRDFRQVRTTRLPPGGWYAANADLLHLTSPQEPLQGLHEVASFYKTMHCLSATVTGAPELRTAELGQIWRVLEDNGVSEVVAFHWYDGCQNPRPWLRSIVFQEKHAILLDRDIACYDTDYDHTVAELHKTYRLYEEYATALLMQSAQSLDGMAFSALIVHELEKAGF